MVRLILGWFSFSNLKHLPPVGLHDSTPPCVDVLREAQPPQTVGVLDSYELVRVACMSLKVGRMFIGRSYNGTPSCC